MNNFTIFLVLKKGGDYHFQDVELIFHHLRKNWKQSFSLNIFCITDLVSTEVKLSEGILLPIRKDWKGWWSKMNLFSPELGKYRPFIYFDLDTAIVGDYFELFVKAESVNGFIALRDFYHNKLASGMMYFSKESKKIEEVWKRWAANPNYFMQRYRGDQDFIGAVCTADEYWQDITALVSSFKPKSGWLYELPKNISVVCFHGKPRIPDAARSIEWIKKYYSKC